MYHYTSANNNEFLSGDVSFGSKVGQCSPNGTNPEFSDQISVHLEPNLTFLTVINARHT